jgi:hypothetical protein
MGSRTRYVNLENWDEEESSLTFQLMCASNDIMMTEQVSKVVQKMETRDVPEFFAGSKQYLFRLQCAQLWEAIQIIPKLTKCNSIRIIICRSQKVQDAFNRLLEYTKTGEYQKSFAVLNANRNQAMFHYEYTGYYFKKQLANHIADGNKTGKVVMSDGNNCATHRFALADEISDRIFSYDILGHNDSKPFSQALDESTKILKEALEDFVTVSVAVVSGVLATRYR